MNSQNLVDNERAEKVAIPPLGLKDEDIVESILQGRQDAYAKIMRRYNQRMYRIARSIVKIDTVAMDVVQEAHFKAYTKLGDFKALSSFKSWLYAITRNEALMYLRKHKREQDLTETRLHREDKHNTTALAPVSVSNLTERALENKELQNLMNSYIDDLQDDFREVFVLRGIEQLSVKETAEILGIKEETVKTRFFRAKKLLRDEMQNYLDAAGMKIYEFGGEHCNQLIANFFARLSMSDSPPLP